MKCRIYQAANSALTPYQAGYKCAGLVLTGEMTKREYFNPFEPDTKEGEEWDQGAYQRVAEHK